MERAVGEAFEFNGVKLQVKSIGCKVSCKGCYFDKSHHVCQDMINYAFIGFCYEPYRNDGNNVIFVEVSKE